jgi:undecaprenyl-diphosphatase
MNNPVRGIPTDAAKRRTEFAILACVLVAAILILGLLVLASEVFEGETMAFDRAILISLRTPGDLADPVGPVWLEIMMQDLTSLGGTTVLTIVTFIAGGYFLVARQYGAAILTVATVAGGTLVSNSLKLIYVRPRPEIVAHIVDVHTFSFPSGHAMLSAVTYLTLGALLARWAPDKRRAVYILIVAAFLTVSVGISRVYLGVHYPTDVLAGWGLGAAWAMLCWAIALWLQRKQRV